MLKRLSLFIMVFIIMSFQSAVSAQYEINYYGKDYLVQSGVNVDDFIIKDPASMNTIEVGPDVKADLFHASRAIQRVIAYDPSNAKQQLNNEFNKAVAKYKQNGIVSEWVNTQLESAASFATSGAISFAKVKGAEYLCKRRGGTACVTVGTALVASAVIDMGDSLGGSVISNKHLFDEQRSFSLIKDAVKTSYDEIDEFSTVRQQLIAHSSSVNYKDLVVTDFQIDGIQKNTQELIPVLQSVSTFGSTLTPLQRIARGISTSVVNGVTGFPASSTVAALSVMLTDEVVSGVYDNINNKLTSAVNSLASEFVSAYVVNTSNIVKVNKLSSEIMADMVLQAAKLIIKQKKEQQAQAEFAAANVQHQKVNNEKSYQQVLENTRKNMWHDLADMQSVLDNLSDDLINASTVNELETAVSAAKSERNNARSLKRMHERNYNGYSHVIDQLQSGSSSTCYSYVGCFNQSDLSELKLRKSESYTLLNDYIAYFERSGGLEQVYDSAREQLAAAKKEQLHQAQAAQYEQEAKAAHVAAALAAQQAADAQQQINNTPVNEIPDVAALPEPLIIQPQGANNEELLVKLVTGSPVSISQIVDVPLDSFSLSFDYFFETEAGSLDVLLDDILLGTLLGDSSQTDFLTANMLVDGQFLGLNDVNLKFLFTDSQSGSVLWLDNIVFPDLADGLFSQGLTYWLPQGDGYAEVVNYTAGLSGSVSNTGGGNTGSTAPSAVPTPGTLLLLIPGFVLLFAIKAFKPSVNSGRIAVT